jgi:hypothetical protein
MQGAEHRATEVGGGLVKWFKKYAIILVPGTFFTILTVDIVNNVNHRNFIEKLSPSYVDLVRKYHGFDDEDFPEKKRLEFLNSFYDNNFILRIQLQDGSSEELVVSGRQSVLQTVRNALQSSASERNISQTELLCSSMVEVVDGPLASETYSVGAESPTVESMLGDPTFNEFADLRASASSSEAFINSHWTPHLSADYRQALGMRFRFFENLVFRPYVCIQSYLALGTPGLFPFSYGQQQTTTSTSRSSQMQPSSSQSSMSFFSSTNSNNNTSQPNAMNASAASSSSEKDQERAQAKLQVENLELEIKQLEEQKRLGFRDMDTVNEEIQSKRQEISRLRRKYLNGFFSLW